MTDERSPETARTGQEGGMKLTYGEKAAIRMLTDARISDQRAVMVMDALESRSGRARLTHILYLVIRYARLRGAS